MVVTIHQPEFLPYTGFFERLAAADVFVVLDDVGYQKNGFINRNKIMSGKGPKWLTVPVLGRSPNLNINQVSVDNSQNWGQSLWQSISQNYSKTPYFKEYSNFFKETFEKKWERIADLDIYLLENINKFLGINVKIIKSSDLRIQGKATERLVNILKELKADTYLSGPGGKDYMDLDLFKTAGIKVIFHQFLPDKYSQPDLSVVDLLFNQGKNSGKIIKKQ